MGRSELGNWNLGRCAYPTQAPKPMPRNAFCPGEEASPGKSFTVATHLQGQALGDEADCQNSAILVGGEPVDAYKAYRFSTSEWMRMGSRYAVDVARPTLPRHVMRHAGGFPSAARPGPGAPEWRHRGLSTRTMVLGESYAPPGESVEAPTFLATLAATSTRAFDRRGSLRQSARHPLWTTYST